MSTSQCLFFLLNWTKPIYQNLFETKVMSITDRFALISIIDILLKTTAWINK